MATLTPARKIPAKVIKILLLLMNSFLFFTPLIKYFTLMVSNFRNAVKAENTDLLSAPKYVKVTSYYIERHDNHGR